MERLSILMVLAGAGIMGFNVCKYSKTLNFMRGQLYNQKIFNNWIYVISFVMMIFFLIGYGVFATVMSINPFDSSYTIVSVIFFFGAIFVLIMIQVQEKMAHTIIQRTTETLQSMVDSMEAKDLYTKGHSENVRNLVELIYKHLPDEEKNSISLEKLRDAAILHDIGKIGIPDSILNKPDKLTDEEMQIIRTHPLNGKLILEKTCYSEICTWVLYHHERIDGQGYYKIKEKDIPIEARIITLADTFSALYTDRIYRKKFTFEKAVSIIKEEAGLQLDEYLVDVFCSIDRNEIDEISHI